MSLPLVISVGCLLFCFIAFLYFRSYINRKTSFEGVLKDVRDEVNRLLQRIDEITEKDISLIEDREKQLKAILEESDRRLALLNKELDRREIAEKTYREIGKNPPPVIEEKPKPPENNPQSLEDQISALALSGFSPSVIASRLGISITEAELAVALLERKNSL
ncbi:MAG: hypothetical protein LBI14_04665 [Treponema sp.]|jgi:septal ring factor EnvC (AmiA/AmiB activator)|nr:hypothetical protein [Treponema sp.]